ncbi:hypothetical protein Tco_0732028 [Tanacetum coccineum]
MELRNGQGLQVSLEWNRCYWLGIEALTGASTGSEIDSTDGQQGLTMRLGNLPSIHLEFEELELDRLELDKQEVEQPEVDRFDLDEPGVVSCGCLRDIFLDIISINIASGGWASLVGMSTTASNTTFLNRFDRSRSGRLIFLIKK